MGLKDSNKKIYLYDTTLRDGAQTPNVSFSKKEKMLIINFLEKLKIDYIEYGNPNSNPKDYQIGLELSEVDKKKKFVAFTSTRKKNSIISNDRAIVKTLEVDPACVAIVGKASKKHVDFVLESDTEENDKMVYESIKYFKDNGKFVIFDAEDFYSGCRENMSYSLHVLEVAKSAGADVITLCDTTGGASLREAELYTKMAYKMLGDDTVLGVHFHNDCGLALANSLISIDSGASLIQGTFFGIGERCGNADLLLLICVLQLKYGYSIIPEKYLSSLKDNALKLSKIIGIEIPSNYPFIGDNAFSHKAGMHVSAVLKNSATFEHMNPEIIGNKRRFIIGELSGKKNIQASIAEKGYEYNYSEDEIHSILTIVKENESRGYNYEIAKESYDAILLGFTNLKEWNVHVVSYKNSINNNGEYSVDFTLHVNGDIYEEHETNKLFEIAVLNIFNKFIMNKTNALKLINLNEKFQDKSISVVLVTCDSNGKQYKTMGVENDKEKAYIKALCDAFSVKNYYDQIGNR